MHLLDLTLATPQENLALDEALLEEAEDAQSPRETLRLWESPEPFVVVGRSSQFALEVNLPFCQQQRIPILRRASGGAAIVAAPGCLMYAVVLSYEKRPHLRSLDQAHSFVLNTTLAALKPLVSGATRQGTSDLTLGQYKFSGNSVRCKRRNFLYHGTLLYDFPLPLVEQCLLMPSRQPEYRQQRAHRQFIANLPLSAATLRQALIATWQARDVRADWPRERVRELVSNRYTHDEWNAKR
jgi:lipoate---protein ligase